jgi:hypothetical protein
MADLALLKFDGTILPSAVVKARDAAATLVKGLR